MQEPSLVLFANGWVSNTVIGVPAGQEPIYHWAGPVSFSLAVFFFGLWLVRGSSVRTGRARALLWAGAGCLAVCYSAWGIGDNEGHRVFRPTWTGVWAFPGLAVLGFGWWLVRGRLERPGPVGKPFRPWLETLAGCLALGYFLWWFGWTVFDLNWRGMRGWFVWSVVAMPWLWAGACSAVVWRGWQKARSPAGRRVQTALVAGAGVGFLGGCVLVNLVSSVIDGIRALIPEDDGNRYDKDARLLAALIGLGLVAFVSALFNVVRIRFLRAGWEDDTAPPGANGAAAHSPAGEPVAPTNTSSG
jgi:hypothetical protein